MNNVKQTVEKQKRHIERREATSEIAGRLRVPVREVRRVASLMSTEHLRRWLSFEQSRVTRF